MKFHVAGLLQEPVGATRRHEVAEDVGQIDEQLAATEPVKGQAKLTHTNAGILVDVRLRTVVRLNCSRCLIELTVPLDVRFSEEYQPVLDMATGLPLPRPEDQSVFTIGENHILDLSEAFRQYALLALPMAPLCDAACAGLCPECGQNLNEGPCQCAPAEADRRWGPLAEYLRGAAAEGLPGVDSSAKTNQKKTRKR